MKKNNLEKSYFEIRSHNGRKKIVWRKGRSQGLEGAKGRIGKVVPLITKLLEKKRSIRVLEIGCGFGRALLELKKIFGERIETYGVNKEKSCNQLLIKKYAISEGFCSQKEVFSFVPKVYVFDASRKFPLKSDFFDFVFCQATMQYIDNKAIFIEEIHRILAKQGIAVLELQEERVEHPEEYRVLFEIWDGGKKIEPISFLRRFENITVKKSTGRNWHYMIMRKTKDFYLGLYLVNLINLEEISPKWWGRKSVYVVKR